MTRVVLDTDIGTDIDDTWALAMLLGCPELDLRLVVGSTGDTTYRARIVAGLLAAAGRDDVPVGIGAPTVLPVFDGGPFQQPQGRFADEVALDRYRGTVHADGAQALVDCVMSSPEPVTIIAIGPASNVAAALALEPRIAEKARLVGMYGSVQGNGLAIDDGPIPEYNVVQDVPACRAAFAAPWEVTITPLDTCGSVLLRDDRYARVRDANGPLMRAVMRNYEEWADRMGRELRALPADQVEEHRIAWAPIFDDLARGELLARGTTVLFDTVAVYLAYDESLLNVESLPIALDDDGTMRITPGAPELRVATSWRDREGFADHLLERLLAAGA
jgi:inosine-uridine nucleoside N-ribohydrolase